MLQGSRKRRFAVRIVNHRAAERDGSRRTALRLKESTAANEEQIVELPAGAEAAEFPWTLSFRDGADGIASSVLSGSPSPLGLWTGAASDEIAFELRVYPNLRRR